MTTEYASAVAAVRALEENLLSSDDMTRLINTANYHEFSDVLRTAGRSVPDSDKAFEEMLETELENVWHFITGFTGKNSGLEILLYKNDFHNLKAALKSLMMNTPPERFFIKPTNLDLKTLSKTVSSRLWEELPEYIRDYAADTYELLTKTMDGQIADAVIDKACLAQMQISAEKTGNEFMRMLVNIMVVCSDIKTAYRCSRMNKQMAFLEAAICGSRELDKDSLIKAACSGADSFLSYLEGTSYNDAAELLKTSASQFEKWCDNKLVEFIGDARMKCFGIEPLAAYFIAKEMEIKNLRMILVCKECGIPHKDIIERMRVLYV